MGPFNFYINIFILYKKDECMFATINDVKSNRHLKSSPDLFRKRFPIDYEKIISSTPEELPWIEKLYWYFNNITEHPVCETCGNIVRFDRFERGYNRFCSPGCVSKNSNIKIKKQLTCESHYGVDNPSKNKDIQEKKRITKIEKYGNENYVNIEQIRATKLERYGDENYNNIEKRINTCRERFGVDSYMETEQFVSESQQTKQDRYGDKNYNNPEKNKSTKLVRYGDPVFCNHDKARQTKLERYGDPEFSNKEKRYANNLVKFGSITPFGSEAVQNKKRETVRNKYGVDNVFMIPEVKEKIKKTIREKYGVDHITKNQDVRKKLSKSIKSSWDKKDKSLRDKIRLNNSISKSPDDVINSFIKDDRIYYTCKCPHNECNKCVEKTYECPSNIHSNRSNTNIELCTKLMPIQYDRISGTTIELYVCRILDSLNIIYKTNDRTILNGKELDIYIPEKNLAIECNGIYWHSLKEPSFHYRKWKQCKEKGIQLLSIWEDQIINKPEIIKGLILSRLGIYDTRIQARQCVFKEVSSKESMEFLEKNHLQGQLGGSVRYGLYYKGELVSLMVFGKKRKALGSKDEKDKWELYRYCNKIGIHVTAGASRLFKHFLKNHPGCIVESFSSNDISMGNLYKKLGFGLEKEQNGSYWYIDKMMQRHHRYTFRKDILIKNGADPNKTEFQITDEMGLYRIYDSGQQKWIFMSK